MCLFSKVKWSTSSPRLRSTLSPVKSLFTLSLTLNPQFIRHNFHQSEFLILDSMCKETLPPLSRYKDSIPTFFGSHSQKKATKLPLFPIYRKETQKYLKPLSVGKLMMILGIISTKDQTKECHISPCFLKTHKLEELIAKITWLGWLHAITYKDHT